MVRSQLDKRNLSSTRAQDTSVGPCVSMCYSIFMLFVYMCVRMPLSSRSIAGVPSGRVLFSFFPFGKAATQLARQVQQERTQVVCSNMVGRSRLAQRHSRNGPHTYEY